jgi:hypothetical protein
MKPPYNPSARVVKPVKMNTVKQASIIKRINDGRNLSEGQKVYMGIIRRGDPDECFYCHLTLDDENRTLDHYVPKSKGGGDGIYNMKLACCECNHKKGQLDPDVFMRGAWLAGRKENLPKVVPIAVDYHTITPDTEGTTSALNRPASSGYPRGYRPEEYA